MMATAPMMKPWALQVRMAVCLLQHSHGVAWVREEGGLRVPKVSFGDSEEGGLVAQKSHGNGLATWHGQLCHPLILQCHVFQGKEKVKQIPRARSVSLLSSMRSIACRRRRSSRPITIVFALAVFSAGGRQVVGP